MTEITLDALTRAVTTYLRKHARELGLNPQTVSAEYILNWGGFVNASFHVSDGSAAYHLKLADEDDAVLRLARWMHFANRLTERYHAPKMVDWVKLPRLPFEGALFQYVPGQPADFAAQPQVLQGVLDLLAELHQDQALARDLAKEEAAQDQDEAAYLGMARKPYTCADYFMDVYIDRFDGDLAGILVDLPPFVPISRYDWMVSETRHLDALARELPAFQAPAAAPTHGDLWPSNVLVSGDQFHIIDWDDLSLGDPALEYSIVLGPLWRKGLLTVEAAEARLPDLPGIPDDNASSLKARFRLCLRALLLDEIIDSLADWIEAAFMEGAFEPAQINDLRAAKERTHRDALELYRRLFP